LSGDRFFDNAKFVLLVGLEEGDEVGDVLRGEGHLVGRKHEGVLQFVGLLALEAVARDHLGEASGGGHDERVTIVDRDAVDLSSFFEGNSGAGVALGNVG